jgi:hypothetical protein
MWWYVDVSLTLDYVRSCFSVVKRIAGRHVVNAVTFILNGILKSRLQEIGTMNCCDKVKQFVLVELDQEINVNKIAFVESVGIT